MTVTIVVRESTNVHKFITLRNEMEQTNLLESFNISLIMTQWLLRSSTMQLFLRDFLPIRVCNTAFLEQKTGDGGIHV